VKNTFIGLCAFISLFLLNLSCQKIDATTMGRDLIPGVDNVNTFDTTLEVITDVRFLTDSTGASYLDDQALGVMEDPEFGRTTANMFFEVLPPSPGSDPFTNKDSLVAIDSVILSLGYRSVYGDSTSREIFTVYEVSQLADYRDTVAVYPAAGPDIPVIRTLSQPFLVDFNTLNEPKMVRPGKDTLRAVNNVLRIPLNVTFGERLFNFDTSAAYKTDSAFRTYFKGLAIKPDTNASPYKKGLAYFNLLDPNSRLIVYYRFKKDNVVDTSLAEFAFDDFRSVHRSGFFGRSANTIIRNPAGSNYLNNVADAETNQEKLYIQSSPGSYASIYVPGLDNLSNRLVYKAELIVEVEPSVDNHIFTPPILFLDLMDSANQRFKTIQNDFVGDPSRGSFNVQIFGGAVKLNKYTFDISRHIQGIVTRNNPVYSYRLYAPAQTYTLYSLPNAKPDEAIRTYPVPWAVNSRIAAGRVVLTGGGSSKPEKMRIRIIYSKI
jgi:hypothetical protein